MPMYIIIESIIDINVLAFALPFKSPKSTSLKMSVSLYKCSKSLICTKTIETLVNFGLIFLEAKISKI